MPKRILETKSNLLKKKQQEPKHNPKNTAYESKHAVRKLYDRS